MTETSRNNPDIYDAVAGQWWSDDIRWVRALKNLVSGRLKWFDRLIDRAGLNLRDLGCAGGFMADALNGRGATVTGLDPATQAKDAARTHATAAGKSIRYDGGVGEDQPNDCKQFDAVVCVDVWEHVNDLSKVMGEVARVLKPGATFLFDMINRNPVSRFCSATIAENILRLLPKGTPDPERFIAPQEMCSAMGHTALVPGPMTGPGPRGFNRRGDVVFGPLPLQSVIYIGLARKPKGP